MDQRRITNPVLGFKPVNTSKGEILLGKYVFLVTDPKDYAVSWSDRYDSMVVIETSKSGAVSWHPRGYRIGDRRWDSRWDSSCWVHYELVDTNLKVKQIGELKEPQPVGVILASFNAA